MKSIVLSGSFNPLHISHLEMAHEVLERFGYDVIFETSIKRYDKPDLTQEEQIRIKSQFDSIGRKHVFTEAVSFLQKQKFFYCGKITDAKGFPVTCYKCPDFVIGGDTANRLCDVNHGYFGCYREMVRVHESLSNSKFYVFSRQGVVDNWKNCNTKLKDSFIHVDTVQLPKISSTELRNKQ
jgi:nicotinic acid mononucleotide adenylyltransferase